ncbi:MAG: hypothetical protein JWP03_329 [Phycisphaerales bacterium]|jgi:hypothetical protein|nr:hypothetical protein [Phycisphaerales bacterium]
MRGSRNRKIILFILPACGLLVGAAALIVHLALARARVLIPIDQKRTQGDLPGAAASHTVQRNIGGVHDHPPVKTADGRINLPYHVAFINETAEELTGVGLHWAMRGQFANPGAGSLGPNGGGGIYGLGLDPPPAPLTAAVEWKTPDGRQHRQEVEVRKFVPEPEKFNGTIFFRITSDGVKVVALTFEEMLRRDEAAVDHPTHAALANPSTLPNDIFPPKDADGHVMFSSSVALANKTTQALSKVGLRWEMSEPFSHLTVEGLAPGAGMSYGLGTNPPPTPATATVEWTTPNGKQHRQEVEVRKLLAEPDRFNGTIYLKITDEGVKVVPLTIDERFRRARAGEEYP